MNERKLIVKLREFADWHQNHESHSNDSPFPYKGSVVAEILELVAEAIELQLNEETKGEKRDE